MKKLLLALALSIFTGASVQAQVQQDQVHECVGVFNYGVNPWGPPVCRPPAPYDLFNVPSGGWGATPACSTGGSYDCSPGDTYQQSSTGSGVGHVLSSNFLFASGTVTLIPGLSVGAFTVNSLMSAAQTPITVTTTGGMQVNSLVVGQYDIVDILLFRDVVGGASVQIGQRRVYAANSVTQQAASQWAFTIVDRPAAGGIYSYHVSAQLIANNGAAAVVAGSAITVPWLRGTVTASQVNQ